MAKNLSESGYDGGSRCEKNKWIRLLAYVTGLVNQELLLQNEYLVAENRILRGHLPARLRLADPERSTFAEIGKRLGRKAVKEKYSCDVAVIPQQPAKALATTHSASGLLLAYFVVREQ